MKWVSYYEMVESNMNVIVETRNLNLNVLFFKLFYDGESKNISFKGIFEDKTSGLAFNVKAKTDLASAYFVSEGFDRKTYNFVADKICEKILEAKTQALILKIGNIK